MFFYPPTSSSHLPSTFQSITLKDHPTNTLSCGVYSSSYTSHCGIIADSKLQLVCFQFCFSSPSYHCVDPFEFQTDYPKIFPVVATFSQLCPLPCICSPTAMCYSLLLLRGEGTCWSLLTSTHEGHFILFASE